MDFVLANWHLFLALAVVVVALLWGPITQRMLGVNSLAAAEAVRLMNHENGVVVDVCETSEFREGHIPGAVNAPLSALKDRMSDIEKYKDRPVIVSCRHGNRSVRGALWLRRHGFARVYSLAGGLSAWQRENLPLGKG
jgi:rhodanese-related sulfurtransferase